MQNKTKTLVSIDDLVCDGGRVWIHVGMANAGDAYFDSYCGEKLINSQGPYCPSPEKTYCPDCLRIRREKNK